MLFVLVGVPSSVLEDSVSPKIRMQIMKRSLMNRVHVFSSHRATGRVVFLFLLKEQDVELYGAVLVQQRRRGCGHWAPARRPPKACATRDQEPSRVAQLGAESNSPFYWKVR